MKSRTNILDLWGTTTSLLCAIHCALLPIVISYGYLQASNFMSNPMFEVIVLGMTGFFVYYSILKPYFKHKHNPISFYMAISGIILVIFHHLIPDHGTIIIVLGGILIASSHLINLIIAKRP